MSAADRIRQAPPPHPQTGKPLTERIEYEHTSSLDAHGQELKPTPPPGDGWRLAAMAYGNGRLHYAWGRKVAT